jgi:hypothetical protein
VPAFSPVRSDREAVRAPRSRPWPSSTAFTPERQERHHLAEAVGDFPNDE